MSSAKEKRADGGLEPILDPNKKNQLHPTILTRFIRIGTKHVLETHIHIASNYTDWFYAENVFEVCCVPILKTRLRARLRSLSSSDNNNIKNGKDNRDTLRGTMTSSHSNADVFRDPKKGFQMAYFFRKSPERRTVLASHLHDTSSESYTKLLVVPRTLEVIVEPFNPLAAPGSKLASQNVPDFLNLQYKYNATIDHYFLPVEQDSSSAKSK